MYTFEDYEKAVDEYNALVKEHAELVGSTGKKLSYMMTPPRVEVQPAFANSILQFNLKFSIESVNTLKNYLQARVDLSKSTMKPIPHRGHDDSYNQRA